MRKKDNLADVALTPSQRALLGLDPKDTPPVTPTTKYVTPPRYPRSSTPRNASPGSRVSDNHNSPLSRNGSPLVGLQASDSPAPSSPSPLWHQAVASSQDFGRRSSFGSSSSSLFRIGPSAKDHGILGASSTPSPSAGRGASVSLNNRWLYERGRADSGSRGIYS